MSVSSAYLDYGVACDNLKDAMLDESRQKALEYYRSEQRPIDEASREKLKSIAEQMQACIKKRVTPDSDQLNKWAIILVSI